MFHPGGKHHHVVKHLFYGAVARACKITEEKAGKGDGTTLENQQNQQNQGQVLPFASDPPSLIIRLTLE